MDRSEKAVAVPGGGVITSETLYGSLQVLVCIVTREKAMRIPGQGDGVIA